MPEQDLNQSRTTQLDGSIQDFDIGAETPDEPLDQEETVHYFTNATIDYSYFKNIPQYNSVTKALATWTIGIGYTVKDSRTKIILNNLSGQGNEGFQEILFNAQCMKKALGDFIAEVVRNEDGTLINIKPLWLGNMAVVFDRNGIVKHYFDVRNPKKKLLPKDVFHISNDRMNNEMHGNPSSTALKWIIEAKQEAMEDWRRISHRSTIRVLYIEVDNTTQLNKVRDQYKEGIRKGEVLILPIQKGEAQFEDLQLPPVEAFLAWIRYLDNLFYQVSGVPKIIATSEDFSEAGGKVGFLTFQPSYTKEQTEMEAALWDQLGIKIKFKRPPQLGGMMEESEEKNTGQTGIQPSDTQATITRNE